MSRHDDDNEAFDALLSELEQAVSSIGDDEEDPDTLPISAASFDLSDASEGSPTDESAAASLREQPRSLVDVRALNYDQPLSHGAPAETRALGEPTPPEVGAIVDQKYEILAETPHGFAARHVMLRQKFILQLLAPEVADDPAMWAKFQSDIRSAGLLGHEHLEFVTDLGRCPTYGAYLVKQWMEGPTLEDYLARNGPRPLAEAVGFAHSVGGAIAALHEVGIVHGRLSPRNVRRVEAADGPTWKVLDVCVPRGNEVPLAPEQSTAAGGGPSADQYALAQLTWQLLVGADASVDAPASVPAPVTGVLRRAMDREPRRRFGDVETMLGALHEAASSAPAPSVDPFDRREATRNVRAQQPAQNPFEARPKSMRVALDRTRAVPRVTIDFATRARLRREYRRNILAGGLFVPTADMLPLNAQVRVAIGFPIADAAVEVDAKVVNFDPGTDSRPRGYGVAFDPAARAAIEQFVQALETPDLTPRSRLVVKRQLDRTASFGAGAAFLLSRLGGGLTVGSARAMFSGLPYDFDACLSALFEGGWVDVESPSTPAPIATRAVAQAPASAVKAPPSLTAHEWENSERVLETVDYFEEQGNFMAAGRVLESAAQNAPGVPAYLNRLGLLRARFDMDLDAARTAIRRARALAPDDPEIRASERYIATLVEISAVRVLWEHDFADEGRPRWVRSEPELGRVWFAVDAPGERTLVEVAYRVPRVERDIKRSNYIIVAENSPEFGALEHRKPIDASSGVRRHVRQVEIARRFGKFGPHFVRAPAPAALSANAVFAATLHGDELVVTRPDLEPVRIGSGDIVDVRFSPDDQSLAWTVREASDHWALHVSPVTGPAARRAVFETRPSFAWTDDSNAVVALERRPGRLHHVDRRTGQDRLLGEWPGFVDLTLLTGLDGMSALVVGNRVIGEKRWIAHWVDLASGAVRGTYIMPDALLDAALRPDGRLAATLRDGRLFLADLNAGTRKTVSTVSPYPGSLRGSRWSNHSPLVLVEIVETTARVLSIDAALLCG